MRRPLVALVAVAALAATVATGAPPARAAPRAAQGLQASRAELVLLSADLNDRLESAQAAVVAAQMRQRRSEGTLGRMRDRMRTRAVRAYVRGPDTALLAPNAPHAYLEVAAAKERQLVDGYRSASAEAAGERERAESARSQLRLASAELGRVQAHLEAAIAAEDMRRSEEQRQADEARRAAQEQPQAEERGYSPSPRDPAALLPRHKQATQRQLDLMRRVPFGPLRPGAPLPAGLRPTGQRVVGEASWYGPGFNGRPTASGAIYDQEAWTVASKELPLGTILLVTRGERRVLLLVNDRGPYVGSRVLDLSAAAARAVGLSGVGAVVAEVVSSP